MIAAFEDLQTDVAKGVFEEMKLALENAANAAVDNINGNLKTMADYQSTSGSMFAVLKAAQLGNASFSGHCGFHTNEQTICHLLHLIVQLAIFPRTPMAATFSSQTGPAFSAYTSRGSTMEPTTTTCAAIQTDPIPEPPKKLGGPTVGVRIGGGYHLVQTEEKNDQFDMTYHSLPGSTASPEELSSTSNSRYLNVGPSKPTLENVASATLYRDSSQSPPPSRERNKPTEEITSQNPYVFGARSGGTPSERFRISSFVPGAHEKETVLPDQEIRKHRAGEGVHLSRYLGRPGSKTDRRSARPMSARSERSHKAWQNSTTVPRRPREPDEGQT